MPDATDALSDRVASLERQVARQQAAHRAELTTLRKQLARRHSTLARILAATLIAALLHTPLGTLAASFVDLNPGSPHNADINAIADAGISKGCTDNQHYCPNGVVTREQMASFLARTAGLGGNPPIANAQTAVSAQSATTAANATNATNANHATSADTATTATNAANATNADQLGGVPASGYLQNGGDLIFTFSPVGFRTDDAPVQLTYPMNGSLIVGISSAPGNYDLLFPLDVPIALFDSAPKLTSVEICSFTDGLPNQPFITTTTLRALGAISDDLLAADGDDHQEGGCFPIAPQSPVVLAGALTLRVVISFPNTTTSFQFMRVKVTMTP